MAAAPNVVLVHGAWADGSCWSDVIERLQADGHKVTAPQLPETSLADDVARVHHVLTRQSGPTILAGHSYGGQVITSLGTDAPNVVGLVYIAAFGLDEGESIGGLLQGGPPTPALANIDVDSNGFAWLPEADFINHFAADIDPVKAKVMHAVQQPLPLTTFDDVMGTPAWKSLPSWYLVAENDEVIPPDAERQFAQRMGADTIEVASGHCAMVSHPAETYERIATAANAAAEQPARSAGSCADAGCASRQRRQSRQVRLDSERGMAKDPPVDEAPHYAFPHAAADESRRLELFEQRLDR